MSVGSSSSAPCRLAGVVLFLAGLLAGFHAVAGGVPEPFSDTGQRLGLVGDSVLGVVAADLDLDGRSDLLLQGFDQIQAFLNTGTDGSSDWFAPGPVLALPGVQQLIRVRLDADREPEFLALVGDGAGSSIRRVDWRSGSAPELIAGDVLRSGISGARRLAVPFGDDRAMPVLVLRSLEPHLLLELTFGSGGVVALSEIPIDLGTFEALGAISAHVDGDARPELILHGTDGIRVYRDRLPPLVGEVFDISIGFQGPLAMGLARRGPNSDLGLGRFFSDRVLLHDALVEPLVAESWGDAGLALGMAPTNRVLAADFNQDGLDDFLFLREGESAVHYGTGQAPAFYDETGERFGVGGRDVVAAPLLVPGVLELAIAGAGGQVELWRARDRLPTWRVRLRAPEHAGFRACCTARSPVDVEILPSPLAIDLEVILEERCTDLAANPPVILEAREASLRLFAGFTASERFPLLPPPVGASECRYQILDAAPFLETAPVRILPDRTPRVVRYSPEVPRASADEGEVVCVDVGTCPLCDLLRGPCTNKDCRKVRTGGTSKQGAKGEDEVADDWVAPIVSWPRRLRDEVLRGTPGGSHLADRYYVYGQLALDLSGEDRDAATDLVAAVVFGAVPLIVDLLEGAGKAPIPPSLVDDASALFARLRAEADDALGAAMDADWAAMNLAGFAGEPVSSFAAHIGSLPAPGVFADGFEAAANPARGATPSGR